MANQHTYIERVDVSRVSLALSHRLQEIGFTSWKHELPGRTPEEIGHVFDLSNGAQTLKAHERYQKIAKSGALVVASTDIHTLPVGYIAIENDVSGNIAERFVKKHFRPDKVYAKITNLAIEDAFRAESLEHRLLATALEYFDPERIPTTYIFDEDISSRLMFEELGFIRTDKQPTVVTPFGPGSKPAEEWRYAAPSVDELRATIHTILQD